MSKRGSRGTEELPSPPAAPVRAISEVIDYVTKLDADSLRAMRESLNLRKEEAAVIMGVASRTLHRWEQGAGQPTLEAVLRLHAYKEHRKAVTHNGQGPKSANFTALVDVLTH